MITRRFIPLLGFCAATLISGSAVAQTEDIPDGPGETSAAPSEAVVPDGPAGDVVPDGPAGAVVPDGPGGAAPAKPVDFEEQLKQEAMQEEVGEGRLVEKIEMQRGFYVSSDVGFFLTLAGYRGYSNLQPYIGFNVGYDLTRWLSMQVAVGNGFNSGNGPSAEDSPIRDGNPNLSAINNFSATNVGVLAVGNIVPLERMALEFKLGGGVSRLAPLPRSLDPDKESGWYGHVAGGIAVKYLTLLTDFTAGLDITFYYILPAGIPGLAISPTVRYTF